MAVVLPFNTLWREYVVDQAGTANFNGPWIDVRKSKVLIVHADWLANASGTTTLGMYGVEDPLLNATPVVLTPTVSHGSATVTSGLLQIINAANRAILVYENPPSFVRAQYIGTTGVAAQFDIWAHGRSI